MQPPDITPAVASVPAPTDGRRADRATSEEARRELGTMFIQGALDDATRFASASGACEVAGDDVMAGMWRALARMALEDARRADRRIGASR
jgi:hypothetical protein